MKMKRTKKALSLFLCTVLIVAMALITSGCNDKAVKETTAAESVQETESAAVTVLGEGKRVFDFGVFDLEGNETWFEIHTDEEVVGAALLAEGRIAGDAGPYGLYVKSVNGITADYDKDKVYWAFYVNGEYGTAGVDVTEIKEGDVYSFRISK